MPSHAELAARLLRDAATFFRTLGQQNPSLMEQMSDNATVYEQVANLVEREPLGEINE